MQMVLILAIGLDPTVCIPNKHRREANMCCRCPGAMCDSAPWVSCKLTASTLPPQCRAEMPTANAPCMLRTGGLWP